MKKITVVFAVAVAAASGALSVPADAQCRGCGLGAGIAAGIIGGAIIGGAIARRPPPPRYYYDDEDAPPPRRADAVEYCMERFKSYDPGSGTYLGYDGRRHPCP